MYNKKFMHNIMEFFNTNQINFLYTNNLQSNLNEKTKVFSYFFRPFHFVSIKCSHCLEFQETDTSLICFTFFTLPSYDYLSKIYFLLQLWSFIDIVTNLKLYYIMSKTLLKSFLFELSINKLFPSFQQKFYYSNYC